MPSLIWLTHCALSLPLIDEKCNDINSLSYRWNGSGYKKHCDLKDLCRVVFEPYAFKPQMKTFYDPNSRTNNDPPSDNCESSSDVSFKPPGLMPYQNIASTKLPTVQTRKVFVIKVIDPKTYIIQNNKFLERADQLEKECNQCAMDVGKLECEVDIDEMYLVKDNSPVKWCRGIVTKQENSSFEVYLIDHGRDITVTKKQ